MGINRLTNYYENIEFSLTNGQSDFDLDANEAGFLSKFGPNGSTNPVQEFPGWLEVRTDQTISIKLNSTGNDSITISSTDVPYIIDSVRITNVFLSNASGSSAAVKLRFQLPPVRG